MPCFGCICSNGMHAMYGIFHSLWRWASFVLGQESEGATWQCWVHPRLWLPKLEAAWWGCKLNVGLGGTFGGPVQKISRGRADQRFTKHNEWWFVSGGIPRAVRTLCFRCLCPSFPADGCVIHWRQDHACQCVPLHHAGASQQRPLPCAVATVAGDCHVSR